MRSNPVDSPENYPMAHGLVAESESLEIVLMQD